MNDLFKCIGLLSISVVCLNVSAGEPAARVGDPTEFGGTILPPGALTVLIGGEPAARVGDQTVNPFSLPGPFGPIFCLGGPIITGAPTVLIEGKPAARRLDSIVTLCPAVDRILNGAPTVQIGG